MTTGRINQVTIFRRSEKQQLHQNILVAGRRLLGRRGSAATNDFLLAINEPSGAKVTEGVWRLGLHCRLVLAHAETRPNRICAVEYLQQSRKEIGTITFFPRRDSSLNRLRFAEESAVVKREIEVRRRVSQTHGSALKAAAPLSSQLSFSKDYVFPRLAFRNCVLSYKALAIINRVPGKDQFRRGALSGREPKQAETSAASQFVADFSKFAAAARRFGRRLRQLVGAISAKNSKKSAFRNRTCVAQVVYRASVRTEVPGSRPILFNLLFQKIREMRSCGCVCEEFEHYSCFDFCRKSCAQLSPFFFSTCFRVVSAAYLVLYEVFEQHQVC